MPTSYTRHQASRPIRYRTPSPPRDAVEPISPTATVGFGAGGANNTPLPSGSLNTSQHYSGLRKSAHKPGHRSNGSMELFAEIALATRPVISAQADDPANKRPLNGLDTILPPSKRSRSEKLPSPEMCRTQAPTATRPATSHEQTPQSRMVEAELLLNFSHGARLAFPSPVTTKTYIVPQVSQMPRDSKRESLIVPSFLDQSKETSKSKDAPRIQDPQSPQQKPYFEEKQAIVMVSPSQARALQGREVSRISRQTPNGKDGVPMVIPKESQDEMPLYTMGNTIGISGNSEKGSPDTLSKHSDPPALPEESKALTEKDLPSHESRMVHDARREERNTGKNASSNTCDAPLAMTQAGIADVSQTENRSQKSLDSIAALSTGYATSEKLRSTAFCAACNFQRNSSSVEGESNATSWISCDGCKSWFHFACAGFKNEREVRAVDKFRCKKCKPIFGATTYVRKSSRAHSAIDYAGLHQGVIKTSDERMEHHYIQPIKDGIITFLPESFARMRPELVTADFFEKGGGMKEPVVIPAELNPRPTSASIAPSTSLHSFAEPPEAREAIDSFFGDSENQIVPDEGQDALDMVIPQGLTVRQVAELYGPEEKVEVIDVKSQNGENKKWNMRRWAEYYENPNNKVVRNVISLEVSQSKLGRLIRRPKIVRDLDLQDAVWPEDLLAKGEYPRVQFYCLMSVADCFTDFHIDFGGSSVFYHILKGRKTFLFIPPKEKHLKKYEEWCMSPAQNWTFLADQTKECYRVDLSEGDTMLIPSGWIHAVWTPEDSLVIGGNFLTRMNFGMQLRIAQVEKATGVARKFRYPQFQKLHWYTAFQYMEDDPLPVDLKEEFHRGEIFFREQPIYHDFDAWGENSRPGKRNYNARYYSQGEIEGLRDLTAYLLRTVLIDLGKITEGITAEIRNAVRKSIPRAHGEPLDVIKDFAAWCAWKRGNEVIHHWAYPDSKLEDSLPPEKLSAVTLRKLDREAALEAALQAPRRQSARRFSLQKATSALSNDRLSDISAQDPSISLDLKRPAVEDCTSGQDALTPSGQANKKRRTSSGAGTISNRKTACEACRKRRRACKHKDQVEALGQSGSVYGMSSQNGIVSTQPVSLGGLDLPSDLSRDGEMVVVPQASDHKYAQHPFSIPASADRFKNEKSPDAQERGQGPQSLESVAGNAGVSRPRTKACNDCRKSKVKRRCIHDAFGNEDPIKVAEQAIPRPHARKNHRASDQQVLSRISAADPSSPQASPTRTAPIANMVAPIANMVAAQHSSILEQSTCSEQTRGLDIEPTIVMSQAPVDKLQAPSHTLATQQNSDSAEIVGEIPNGIRPDGERENLATAVTSPIETPAEVEQPPPSSSLISPPASSNDDIGSSPINGIATYSPSPPPISKQISQQSSEEVQQRYTPESGTLRRASSSSFEQQRNEISQKKVQEPTLAPPSQNIGLTPEVLADSESLRLIKELQAQDYGLRRRGKA